ncbi:hypothetical protein QFC21_001555 [Naganishia friedmannii]|uniref:Uncharacterized protein n=1 Tax=Naganishia friedmannii TaxID=89922 RepID=A0ACC2W5D3_9TREE|nr:hypothetical protein QFC21_001555 [Naganishia friedmannii]
MASPLRINIAANPFPWTAAALAAHKGVPIDWTYEGAEGGVEWEGRKGVEEVVEGLEGLFKGKEGGSSQLTLR